MLKYFVIAVFTLQGIKSFAVKTSHPAQKSNLFDGANVGDDTEDRHPSERRLPPPLHHDSRRDVLLKGSGLFTSLLIKGQNNQLTALAAPTTIIGSNPDHPIVILGAGGKVGSLCTQLLADQGLYVRATTRQGKPVGEPSSFISYAAADVTKYQSLQTALAGASGVIFAASASGENKGGDPVDVDFLGSYHTAKACLECGVPKLVLVSAGSDTRPDSAGFKAINFLTKYIYGDHLMDAKIAGETAVRDLYASMDKTGYCVVRAGGLSDKPSVGANKVHVSQGDVYSSEIPRQDVALVTTAALLKGPATDSVTMEVNQIEGLTKSVKTLPDLPSELTHAGAASYEALLDGLLTDGQMISKYPELISDFRGQGIPTLGSLL